MPGPWAPCNPLRCSSTLRNRCSSGDKPRISVQFVCFLKVFPGEPRTIPTQPPLPQQKIKKLLRSSSPSLHSAILNKYFSESTSCFMPLDLNSCCSRLFHAVPYAQNALLPFIWLPASLHRKALPYPAPSLSRAKHPSSLLPLRIWIYTSPTPSTSLSLATWQGKKTKTKTKKKTPL